MSKRSRPTRVQAAFASRACLILALAAGLAAAGGLPAAAQTSAAGSATSSVAGYTMAAGATLPGSEILKLNAAGKYEEARLKALARIVEFKEDIDAYVGLSWSLVSLRRYQEAETYAAKGYAIRKDPRLAQALGEASYYLGKNETALLMLREYIASYPEGTRAGLSFFLCGELYLRLARYMHADISFTAAVRHNPQNPQWWARLGWARENSKKPLKALEAYETALSLNPNLADAKEGKARIQERMR